MRLQVVIKPYVFLLGWLMARALPPWEVRSQRRRDTDTIDARMINAAYASSWSSFLVDEDKATAMQYAPLATTVRRPSPAAATSLGTFDDCFSASMDNDCKAVFDPGAICVEMNVLVLPCQPPDELYPESWSWRLISFHGGRLGHRPHFIRSSMVTPMSQCLS